MIHRSETNASIRVRVQPRASRNQVLGFTDDTLRVRVTAPPEAGKANQAVIELLARSLNVAKSRIRITRGHTSRDKLVEIHSLSYEDVCRRLERLADQ